MSTSVMTVTASSPTASRTFARVEGSGLRASNLSQYAARRTLLADVSLAVPRGEIVAIIGASGAGKTTLLESLAGVRRSHHGTVTLDGMAVTDMAVRQRIGCVPQDDIIHLDLPQRGTVAHAARLRLAATTSRADLELAVYVVLFTVPHTMDRLPPADATTSAALGFVFLLDAVTGLALGLLASALVTNAAQATLALPMLCFPQVLFAGAMVPVDVHHEGVAVELTPFDSRDWLVRTTPGRADRQLAGTRVVARAAVCGPVTPGSRLQPVRAFRDAPAAEFLAQAFGFERTAVCARDDDPTVVEHAEMRWPPGGGVMRGTAAKDDWPSGQRAPGDDAVYVVRTGPPTSCLNLPSVPARSSSGRGGKRDPHPGAPAGQSIVTGPLRSCHGTLPRAACERGAVDGWMPGVWRA